MSSLTRLILVAALGIALAGCSTKPTNQAKAQEQSSQETPGAVEIPGGSQEVTSIQQPEPDAQKVTKVQDPVCGMQLSVTENTLKHTYNSKTYYFCSSDCRDAFVADPAKYAQ